MRGVHRRWWEDFVPGCSARCRQKQKQKDWEWERNEWMNAPAAPAFEKRRHLLTCPLCRPPLSHLFQRLSSPSPPLSLPNVRTCHVMKRQISSAGFYFLLSRAIKISFRCFDSVSGRLLLLFLLAFKYTFSFASPSGLQWSESLLASKHHS